MKIDNWFSYNKADNWGLILVSIYAIAFVVIAIMFSFNYSNKETLPREINIVLQSDSTIRILDRKSTRLNSSH